MPPSSFRHMQTHCVISANEFSRKFMIWKCKLWHHRLKSFYLTYAISPQPDDKLPEHYLIVSACKTLKYKMRGTYAYLNIYENMHTRTLSLYLSLAHTYKYEDFQFPNIFKCWHIHMTKVSADQISPFHVPSSIFFPDKKRPDSCSLDQYKCNDRSLSSRCPVSYSRQLCHKEMNVDNHQLIQPASLRPCSTNIKQHR